MVTKPSGTTIPRGTTSFYDFSQIDDGQQSGATTAHQDEGSGTPAPPPLATPTLNGNNGNSPTSEKEIKSKPYTNPDETFHGTTIGDVEDFLKGRIEYYKSLEESEEDRQKREKRERRYKNLAAIGDILGSFHKAYSHSRGVEAMELPSISEKAQERIDKARLEREKNADRLMNYVITLDKLNSSKAQNDYQQKSLDIKQQQQDRLDKQEETNRNIAEAKVKYYEAQSNKNDEQAAYWKTKAELLERGWPQEQAEQAARIEERKARAAKYSHDASSDGTEKVREKTDAKGRTTTTRTYTQPRRQVGTPRSSGSSSSGKRYTNTKKLGL
ncbi:MAG: hypothetical protein PUE86_09030 [Prevotella sp.]|nr:hypothetical protein [Prevotella sp.]